MVKRTVAKKLSFKTGALPIATACPSTHPPPGPGTATARAAQATPSGPTPRAGQAGSDHLQNTALDKTNFLVEKTRRGKGESNFPGRGR